MRTELRPGSPEPFGALDQPDPPAGQREGRHPGDVLRVVAGVIVVTSCALVSRGDAVGRLEANLFRLVNELPAGLSGLLRVGMQLGSLAAVAVAAGAALLGHRRSLARGLAVSGLAAWGLTKVVGEVVNRGRAHEVFPEAVVRENEVAAFGFPSGHVAVASALATAATPYLGRRARRWVWVAVAVVAVARMYVGAHLPTDVVGGAALGWVVGAATHLRPRGAERPAFARGGPEVPRERRDPAARGSAGVGGRHGFGPVLRHHEGRLGLR